MRDYFVPSTLLIFGVCAALLSWAGGDRPSEYTNAGSIINTRHNFTFRSAAGASLLNGGPNGGAEFMTGSAYVTNYGEVCVYCHTPHGANTSTSAPLWNRVVTTTGYTTYDNLGRTSTTQSYSQPGAASLPCLSCHDGQQAIDAIMNMPRSGMYMATPTNEFLDTFRAANGQSTPGLHSGFNTSVYGSGSDTCLVCHAADGWGRFFAHAGDFRVFYISKDLRDDHPVGVTYPASTSATPNWNVPDGSRVLQNGRVARWFEEPGGTAGFMDKNEIRLYDTGDGPEVECATCHDPHGVPSAGGAFNPSFLRKANGQSALCQTCHVM